jgi:hypothetical protein
VLQGAPVAGEQRESAFAQAAQRALEGVAGAGAGIELPPVCGLLDGDVDADAHAVIAGVSEGGQPGGGGPVQRGQGVDAGGCVVARRLLLGLHAHFRAARLVRVSALMSLPGAFSDPGGAPRSFAAVRDRDGSDLSHQDGSTWPQPAIVCACHRNDSHCVRRPRPSGTWHKVIPAARLSSRSDDHRRAAVRLP